MTALRQKMIDDMQLRGFAERTQEAYLSAVRQLAKHYRKSPDQIDEEELRQYFLFLKNEKHAARNTCTIALCGIKFFFQHTLGREWKTFDFLRPQKRRNCRWCSASPRCALS
jgi:integrase/recombinase XerD